MNCARNVISQIKFILQTGELVPTDYVYITNEFYAYELKTGKDCATMKKIIAACLAVILAVSSFLIFPIQRNESEIPHPLVRDVIAAERAFTPVNVIQPLSAAAGISPGDVQNILSGHSDREGYILAPTMITLTGVDTLSSFLLNTPGTDRSPQISIDGQPQPHIEEVISPAGEAGNNFLITPAVPLMPNSVYVFRLTRDTDPDITWAFQTSKSFEIISTLPRNQATNVPVRTGIEIIFSFGEDICIEDYFQIYPHAEGRFIHLGSTTVFMPLSPLKYGQIYTVRLSPGITANGQTIQNETIFLFETEPSSEQLGRSPSFANFFFSPDYVEFPSFAPPSVSFWFDHNHLRLSQREISMNVYRIDDPAEAIAAVNRLAGTPFWSVLQRHERLIDTSGLTRVYDGHWSGSGSAGGTFTLSETLPPGFYVLHATSNETGRASANQAIIQITDMAVQIIADDERALLWINDMHTGSAAAGARVYDPISGRVFETSEYGIAVVERALSHGEYLKIITSDGMISTVFIHQNMFQSFWSWWGWEADALSRFSPWGWGGWGMGSGNANDNYWAVLQLDRTLFQRSDTVSLWGFVQNRRHEENITHVTAVLTEHSWWFGPERDTLHRQNIPVTDGVFSGEIHLPGLDPGFYELAIFHGNIAVSSVFFSVQDFVKPPYQMTVSSDRAAVFAGEEVTFTITTEFFEGTPVPDLSVSYTVHGWQLTTNRHGIGITNSDGVFEMTVRAHEQQGASGETSLNFWANATLPEIGWVHRDTNVRVFINDIHVRPRAVRDGRDATLTLNVNNITLDRLNNGTAARWDDFLCTPVPGQVFSVEIAEIYWEPVRIGEFYCTWRRQVIPRYRHERRERILETFEMRTDAEGFAERNFSVPDTERRSYRARITTTDGNGRTISRDVFIGRDFAWFHDNAGSNELFLYGAEPEGYDIGDEVELTIMQGTEPVTQGNFLFVVVQNGILSYHIGRNTLNFTFGEQHVPNAQVFAFHFNGHTYQTGGRMTQRLRYNPLERELFIEVSACQEAYRPGAGATLTISVTDAAGNPKSANINISLVDEALFALMDYNVDTLAMLYRNVGDSLRFGLATHRTFVSEGIDGLYRTELQMGGVSALPDEAMAMAPPVAAEADAGGGANDTRVRERFEDTAVFISLRTNAQGEATFTFPLPDNITSWRLTASAISTDLYAGNTVSNIRVTQPMFLHYTLNNVFLTGDRPYVGVNAFGTSLAGGEEVIFEVWRENAPQDIRTAAGAAFERVNIPLWEKTEEGAIIIRARVAGYSDAVFHSYRVINSHREIDMARFYEVTPGMTFEVNPGGLTNITFTDQGRGRFLNDLFMLRNIWRSGARIEGLVARREATRLINLHFPEVRIFGGFFCGLIELDVTRYQTASGGIAILPYADADLEVTVMLLPFIRDDVNLPALRRYLRNIFDTSHADNRIIALYGLAMLGEPVLSDLQRYALINDLSLRNTAYVALGLAVMGELEAARLLYNERVAPHIQRIAPYYRINIGASRREILEATSVAAILAAKLGMPEAEGLHSYSVRHRPTSLLMNVERLIFISHSINTHSAEPASIIYSLFGETVTRDLSRGGHFTLRIPAQNIHEFELLSVTGDVSAVSIIRTPIEDMDIVENDIIITRQFFRAGSNIPSTTFEQGELVRVQIRIDYSARSVTGSYVITDFLPAGLVLVPDSFGFGPRTEGSGWHAWATSEGQRVTFYDFNGRFDRVHTYFYYARVINPGIFRAEGTLVQSLGAREYIAVGECVTLTINP